MNFFIDKENDFMVILNDYSAICEFFARNQENNFERFINLDYEEVMSGEILTPQMMLKSFETLAKENTINDFYTKSLVKEFEESDFFKQFSQDYKQFIEKESD